MRDIEQKYNIGNVIYKNIENFIFASNAFNKICQNYQLKRYPQMTMRKMNLKKNLNIIKF